MKESKNVCVATCSAVTRCRSRQPDRKNEAWDGSHEVTFSVTFPSPTADDCDFTATIQCSSHGYRYAECIVPGGYDFAIITVINRLSRSSCTLGSSYGYRNGRLWVDRGCRAVFSVCQCRKLVSMNCDSLGYTFKSCPVPGAADVTKIALKSKGSRSPCMLNTSFGRDSKSIWVDRGCRATFDVCYE
ncbi:lectin ADEL-like [Mya arenaria]|uniref:lectin ADEL-like n=1 Tax=Mya arenaria TaxID=6604 RepID=UPI0022E2BED7|nr:lectin ADEL-like [Mya arenaria]